MTTSTETLSHDRYRRNAIALTIGLYGIVITSSIGLAALVYRLFHQPGSRNDELVAVYLGIGFWLWVMALPFPRRRYLGLRLDAKSHPELFARLTEIARRVNYEMPAKVLLTMDPDVGVAVRGGLVGVDSKWTLVLSLPVIQSVTISEFEALVAHGFGHLQGGLTVHTLAWNTRNAIARTFGMLPGVDFLLEKLLPPITEEMARDRQLDADRLAARIVGSDTFIQVLAGITPIRSVAEDYFIFEVVPIVEAGFIPPLIEGYAAALSRPSALESKEELPDDSHPTRRERIEALKPLACCENPDKRPALSLLRNLPSVERALTAAIWRRKSKKLKPIAWADVGKAVWLPAWSRDLQNYALALRGLALGDLFDMAGERIDQFAADIDPQVRFVASQGVRNRAMNVLGIAFACSLHRAGWTSEWGPGTRSFKSDASKFDPLEMVTQIASGRLQREEWHALMEAGGLDPSMPLWEQTNVDTADTNSNKATIWRLVPNFSWHDRLKTWLFGKTEQLVLTAMKTLDHSYEQTIVSEIKKITGKSVYWISSVLTRLEKKNSIAGWLSEPRKGIRKPKRYYRALDPEQRAIILKRQRNAEKLFHEAMALEAERRPAFLGASCANDLLLRCAVQLLMEGQSLATIIDSRNLTLDDAILIATGLSFELDYMHRSGFTHGAIATENIMVCPRGQVRLLRFQAGASRNTRSDIIGVGVVLAEMLARISAPVHLLRTVEEAAHPDRDLRYPTAREIQYYLENFYTRELDPDRSWRIAMSLLGLIALVALMYYWVATHQ